jgi:glycosyl hydrolase family 42 (putative beta-galactosidase)
MTDNKHKPEWLKSENLRWAAWAWDHNVFYHRLGSKPANFFGNTQWCEQWWKRVHEEDLVKKMADIGINAAVTHFFKGMGMKAEKKTIDDLKKLVKIFHCHGIKAIGYTMGSIFYETFLKEEPESINWPQRSYDGTIKKYAGRYYRWKPCINSGYINYLKKLVDFGANEIGLDGFHFDNAHVEPCYCKNCVKGFQDYLEANIHLPERLGFTGFQFVHPPPPNSDTHDPLVQEWIRFRVQNVAEKKKEIYDYIKQIDKNLCVLANPGFPRPGNWAEKWGLDPYYFGSAHDLVFAENANAPQYTENRLIHQARAYKFAEAGNYMSISSSWMKNSKGNILLPEKPEEVRLSLLEPAILSNGVGMNWPVRSIRNDQIAIDDAKLANAAKSTIEFLNNHRNLFQKSENNSSVGLLHSFESFAFANEQALPSFNGMEQILIQKNIPYQLAYTKDIEDYNKYKLLIAANLCCLSNFEIKGLLDFVKNGGKLLLTGSAGSCDENYLERAANPFDEVSDSSNICFLKDLSEIPKKPPVDCKWITQFAVALPAKWKEITDAIEKLLPNEAIPVKLEGPESVVLFARSLPEKKIALHLLDYDLSSRPPKNIILKLTKHFSAFKKYIIYSLDGEKKIKPLEPDSSTITVKLSQYACIELS